MFDHFVSSTLVLKVRMNVVTKHVQCSEASYILRRCIINLKARLYTEAIS